MIPEKNLVWIDLEMTGLNADYDVILEIATIITDSQLNIIAQGPSLVVYQSDGALSVMEEYVRNMHVKSGLTEKVRSSKVSLNEAYEQTFTFIKQHCTKHQALLAGNSVWQDRAFLLKYMPDIVKFLHYRIIDISSVKMLVRSWYPTSPYVNFKKPESHRALEDVKESIEELKHYRQHFFIK
jgi:oligoribonuclease